MEIDERFGVVIAAGAADQIREQDAGADGELGDDDMGHRDQRNQHRRGQEWNVPEGEFHNAPEIKLVNCMANNNDASFGNFEDRRPTVLARSRFCSRVQTP